MLKSVSASDVYKISPKKVKLVNAFRTTDAVDQVESMALVAIIDKSSASLDGVVRLRWCRQESSNRYGAAEQVLISTRPCSVLIEPLPLQKTRADSIRDCLSNNGDCSRMTPVS